MKIEYNVSASVKIANYDLVSVNAYVEKIDNPTAKIEYKGKDQLHKVQVEAIKFSVSELFCGGKCDTKADISSPECYKVPNRVF